MLPFASVRRTPPCDNRSWLSSYGVRSHLDCGGFQSAVSSVGRTIISYTYNTSNYLHCFGRRT